MTFEEKPEFFCERKPHHGSGKAAGAIRSAWDSVLLSRKADRPVATDYIHAIFDDFMEFHGDRYCKDDGAIVGGIASFHGMPVTVIGQEKGKEYKGQHQAQLRNAVPGRIPESAAVL